MATSAKVYGLFLKSLLNGEVDYDTNTIKCALLTSSHTPNQDTHQYADDLTNELSGGGYAQQTLASKTVSYTSGTNTVAAFCDDIVFAALTATDIRYAVFFKDTGTPSTSPLICYMDFGADQDMTAQDLTIVMPVSGLVQITAA